MENARRQRDDGCEPIEAKVGGDVNHLRMDKVGEMLFQGLAASAILEELKDGDR